MDPATLPFAKRIEPLELDVDVGLPGRRITRETMIAAAEAAARPCGWCRRPVDDPDRRVPRDALSAITIAPRSQIFCSAACKGKRTRFDRLRREQER